MNAVLYIPQSLSPEQQAKVIYYLNHPDELLNSIEVTESVEDIDLFDRVTNANLTKQTDVTNGSASAWVLKPTATGWSYPGFVFDSSIDISKYELVMDIYPANMTHFRMHLATINDDWGAGEASAVYYGVNKWTTIKSNLSANGAGYTEMTMFSWMTVLLEGPRIGGSNSVTPTECRPE